MTSEMLLTNKQPLRFKIIRSVYEVLTVNDAAAEYFEPLKKSLHRLTSSVSLISWAEKPENTSGRCTSTVRTSSSAWTRSRPAA